MELKDNVIPNGVKPEIVLAILIVSEIYKSKGHSLTVTSICDGRHSRTSLHYVGYAFDCRTRTLTDDERYEVAEDARNRLGRDYDVVLEDDHMHIEYQPKRP